MPAFWNLKIGIITYKECYEARTTFLYHYSWLKEYKKKQENKKYFYYVQSSYHYNMNELITY